MNNWETASEYKIENPFSGEEVSWRNENFKSSQVTGSK